MSQELLDFISNGETRAALAELENNKEKVTRNINEQFKSPYGSCTCLYLASIKGQDEVVKGILAVVGVDVDKGGPHSRTPLHFAAHYNHPTTVRLLLQAGARCLSDGFGNTPIHWAALLCHTAVLQELLQEHSGQINQLDRGDSTALHEAAECGHLPTVTLLIEAGAEPNIKDNYNKTAYDLALNNYHNDVVEYLKEIKHPQQSTSTVFPPTPTSQPAASVPAINPTTATEVSSSTTATSNQKVTIKPARKSSTKVTKQLLSNIKQEYESTSTSVTSKPAVQTVDKREESFTDEFQTLKRRVDSHDRTLDKHSKDLDSQGYKLSDHSTKLDNCENKTEDIKRTVDVHRRKLTDHKKQQDDVENRVSKLEKNTEKKYYSESTGTMISDGVRIRHSEKCAK